MSARVKGESSICYLYVAGESFHGLQLCHCPTCGRQGGIQQGYILHEETKLYRDGILVRVRYDRCRLPEGVHHA